MVDSDKSTDKAGSGYHIEQGRIGDLVGEVMTLFASMQSFRRGLASIRHPKQEEDRFDTIADQLDAIIAATEEATNVDLTESLSPFKSQKPLSKVPASTMSCTTSSAVPGAD